MSSKMPPVPPENRNPKEGEVRKPDASDTSLDERAVPDPDRQGQQANTRINTTHQGHQQDR